MKKLLKISELLFDRKLYSRMREDWRLVSRYADAMRSGSEFPPILVGNFKGKLYVVDGWHRFMAKNKVLKEEYIEAEVKKYTTWKDMFADGVKSNIAHGRQLTYQERVRIVKKLEDMNFTLQKISKIIMIPPGKIERLKARIIIGPDGKPVFLKSIVAKSDASDEDKLSVDMHAFNVSSVKQLLAQIIELLESNVYPLDDKEIGELTMRLFNLLQNKLQVATAS